MKRLLTLSAFLVLAISACAEPASELPLALSDTVDVPTESSEVAADVGDSNSGSVDPVQPSPFPASDFALGQGLPATGDFDVVSVDVVTTDAVPVVASLDVQGVQPTACDVADWTVTVDGTRIDVALYTVANPAATCLAEPVTVEFSIGLGDYEPGSTWDVYVNETLIASFDS